ncbi:tetratricopeptide repeat protein [Lacinutrix chionoecetis]
MKINHLFFILLFTLITSCTKPAHYTPEFIKETSGRYLYNANEEIEVYFNNNQLFLKWRGANKIEPMYLGEDTYFVKEMNKKIQFIKHPENNVYYISEIPEDETSKTTYDYKKLPDSIKVPSAYLKDKEYNKALEGYLAIQNEDSTSVFIEEAAFNRLGYKKMNENAFNEAIEIFKINVALYPESDNVYDSLADAYSRIGDSLKAYEQYKKALQYNTGNRRAKRFIEAYTKKKQ